MNLIWHILLFWAAFAGVVLSTIMAPHVIQNSNVKLWRRTLYCVILGPTVWLIVAAACFVASWLYLLSCDRLRRAKKAAKP